MKNAWKSLKALLASDDDDESDDLDTAPKGAAKTNPFKKEESDDEEKSDDDDSEEKDKKPAKKKKAEVAESETENKTEEKEADAIGSVRLALDDYNGLLALATTAKAATAENKTLKAKAAQWDAYQAALSGGKPAADSAGAKAEEKSEKKDGPVDEHADLRAKHGALMEGI